MKNFTAFDIDLNDLPYTSYNTFDYDSIVDTMLDDLEQRTEDIYISVDEKISELEED